MHSINCKCTMNGGRLVTCKTNALSRQHITTCGSILQHHSYNMHCIGLQTVLCCCNPIESFYCQALTAPQKIVIDLDFSGLMAPNELKSLCQQLGYSYSAAVNGEQQLHLHLLGASGDLEAALHKQLPGHVHWAATKSSQTYKEYFKVGSIRHVRQGTAGCGSIAIPPCQACSS